MDLLYGILGFFLRILLPLLPLGPGPKLSGVVDDYRDEEGNNKELYNDLKYHSNGFHCLLGSMG